MADKHFDHAVARDDLDRYRRDGSGATARLLRDLLVEHGPLGGALLDVGSGIGGLTFELLDRGVERAIAVDMSAAYLAAASDEATRRGRSGAIQFVRGDFLDVAAQLPAAALVTLDRVVCCYPFYEPLLEESLRHAERSFAYSYPRDVWYVRGMIWVENLVRWARQNAFRTFVHPAARMAEVVERTGFTLVAHRQTRQWRADVYVRSRL